MFGIGTQLYKNIQKKVNVQKKLSTLGFLEQATRGKIR